MSRIDPWRGTSEPFHPEPQDQAEELAQLRAELDRYRLAMWETIGTIANASARMQFLAAGLDQLPEARPIADRLREIAKGMVGG
jgi:hypothetical protein